MKGFESPTFTMIPNDFFALAPDMNLSELQIIIYLMRETFGWHRPQTAITIRQLARSTGLSTRSIVDGSAKLEERGLLRRIVTPNKVTIWECVVESSTVELYFSQHRVVPRKGKPSVKEIKEIKEIGDESPNELPLDWKLGHGIEVTEQDIQAETDRKMRDSANLIATGFGINSTAAYNLAYAFQVSRWIVIPNDKVKGQRKAVKEMLEMHVAPAHIVQAVKDLTTKSMTITDLFSVSKTAIDLANPAPNQPAPATERNPLGI